MVLRSLAGGPRLRQGLVIVSAIFARCLGVILLIVLRGAFLADQIERVERSDGLFFGGADASLACLTALDGSFVHGRARWALPLLAVDPTAPGIRDWCSSVCRRPAALVESRSYPARLGPWWRWLERAVSRDGRVGELAALGGDEERRLLGDVDGVVCDPLDASCD